MDHLVYNLDGKQQKQHAEIKKIDNENYDKDFKNAKKEAAKAAKKATSMAKTNDKTSLMANAKAIKELKARHLTSICAEIENLRSTNGQSLKEKLVMLMNRTSQFILG